MNRSTVYRWYRAAYWRMRAGLGYQPYGVDRRTLRMVYPGWDAALSRLARLHNSLPPEPDRPDLAY